jgi:hypothetical protein
VTLGAAALVLLAFSHAPAGQQSVAERHATPRTPRRAFPDLPTTAPPALRTLPYSKRHARASISPVVRPRRRYQRIAGGHAKTPTIAIGAAGGQPSGVPAAGEFDFEH